MRNVANLNKISYIAPTFPKENRNIALSVVILAARPGNRLKSFGPLGLVKASQTSLWGSQTGIIASLYPQAEIITVGGFEIDKLVRFKPLGTRLVENQLFESSGEIEDIRLALNNAEYDNILIIFGNMYFGSAALKGITKSSTLVVDEHSRMLKDDIGATIVNGEATILSMTLPVKWCKIAYFENKEANLLRQFCANRDNGKMFLYECLNEILIKGGKFQALYLDKKEPLIHLDNLCELAKL
jgi:hypothetical protein